MNLATLTGLLTVIVCRHDARWAWDSHLHHRPHTDWQPRPKEEFIALQARRSWARAGSWTAIIPDACRSGLRARGFILLDTSPATGLCLALPNKGKRRMRCVECGGHIKLHDAVKNGSQAAHVEHATRWEGCSRSEAWHGGAATPHPNRVSD